MRAVIFSLFVFAIVPCVAALVLAPSPSLAQPYTSGGGSSSGNTDDGGQGLVFNRGHKAKPEQEKTVVKQEKKVETGPAEPEKCSRAEMEIAKTHAAEVVKMNKMMSNMGNLGFGTVMGMTDPAGDPEKTRQDLKGMLNMSDADMEHQGRRIETLSERLDSPEFQAAEAVVEKCGFKLPTYSGMEPDWINLR
jgi:hypothetical protein